MNYISLFSGIGGFEYGIEKSNKNKMLNCIGYSEVDKYAENIYKKHYPDHFGLGDATKIKTEDLQDFELLVGGFPCQAFSVAGKRGGFDDTRGTLFFEIARILKDKKPKYFLLENVPGLLSHDKGKTFKKILGILAEMGYDVEWKIYNSKNYGVPQNRERIYIKGFLRSKCGSEILSFRKTEKELDNKKEKKLKLWGNLNTNPNRDKEEDRVYSTNGLAASLECRNRAKYISPNNISVNQISENVVYPCTKNGDFFAVTTRHRSMGFHKKQDNYILIKNNTKKGYLEATAGDGIVYGQPTARGRVQPKKSPTLNTGSGCGVGTITDEYDIRRLTPVECERLQGFPDNWTKYGADGSLISDTQRYKCCGNAVTTNVITYIFNEWNIIEQI